MISIERKQRLGEDILKALRELNFHMEDARAYGLPWHLVHTDGGICLDVSADLRAEALRPRITDFVPSLMAFEPKGEQP